MESLFEQLLHWLRVADRSDTVFPAGAYPAQA
jgi:hypothetical protein